MLPRLAHLAIAAPRRMLVLAGLAVVVAAIFGVPVATSLSAGGFGDPQSESARANQILSGEFNQGDMPLVVLISTPDGTENPVARELAGEIVAQLKQSPHVATVTSAWEAPPPVAADLISKDGKSGLVVAGITGDEANVQKHADALAERFPPGRDGVTVTPGGMSIAYAQFDTQTERDLLVMEAIAIPLSFLVLVWVFGGLLAAALPAAVGVVAIIGSMFVLRLVTLGADVSIFALNLTAATGLALGIDYTLLLLNRYRHEVAAGEAPERALIRTMATAGRTVVFSATVVACALSTMVLFPMYFLKSFAYAGVATVGFSALAAIVLTPPAIVLLGDRLNALDMRKLVRKLLRRPPPRAQVPADQMFWYRWAKFVMRHALVLGLAVTAVLLLLGAPFLGVKWGFRDDRALPTSASAHQVGDRLRADFAANAASDVTMVLPDARGLSEVDIDAYAAELSTVVDVTAVSAPTGTFVGGAKTGPPSAPTGWTGGRLFVTARSAAPPSSDRAAAQLHALHAVAAPDGKEVLFSGIAQMNTDTVASITSRLPVVLGLIAAITFVLMFLLTGSLVMPVKTLVLNVLSLTAAFGAMVWIFQDGHLWALGTTPSGTLEATIPMLLFCIAFGLSMDYEVFLISRIREYWLASKALESHGDNDESVALGLAHTGRVITAAAVVMSISFAALIASQLSFMRMFGLGLTLAVLVDATLVRMVLVPAFMHLFGSRNWWAPRPLVWLHDRIGINESGGLPAPIPRRAAAGDGDEDPEYSAHASG